MEENRIHVGFTYAGPRWQGARKVTQIAPRPSAGADPVVHYVDQRTQRTGSAPLPKFAQGASEPVHDIHSPDQVHITEGRAGVYYYHLSASNTNALSLCGASTMNTSLPLGSWGVRGHLKEGWCPTCAKLGERALLAVGATLEPA